MINQFEFEKEKREKHKMGKTQEKKNKKCVFIIFVIEQNKRMK